MTAIVALEHSALTDKVTVPAAAVGVEGSSVYLYADEKLTMGELLYAVMLESANDAATAVAISVAGSVEAFAGLMNEKAAELGMTNSHFTNPHGLDDDEHYTTASDLAKLAAYALKNEQFRTIVSTYRVTIPLHDGSASRLLINHNRLLRSYDGALGVKTGYKKKSGRCLVSAAERDGMTLIAVTLSAPDDWNDHAALLDYGFSLYERVTLAADGELSYALPVVGGTSPYIFARNTGAVYAVLPRDHGEITTELRLKAFYYAPVANGETLGKMLWRCDGAVIAECELYSTFAVPKPEKTGFFGWLERLF